jgi:O-antigen chain-terminating methyltransferase
MLDDAWTEIRALEMRLYAHDRELNRIPPATRAALAGHETTLGDLSEAQNRLHHHLEELTAQVVQGASDLESLPELRASLGRLEQSEHELLGRFERNEADLAQQRARLQLALRAVTDHSELGLRAVADGILAMRESELYAAFEERFRGSREDVIEMLAGYDGELERLAGSGPLIDIGPGRGEWLELAKKAGVDAYGVDTNASFVAAAKERGLDVRLGDGLTHLASLPPSSVEAVSAFHVVEHLTTASLQDLLSAAFAALRPGGLLILETPNPTNLLVGAANFYLDPTHLRPLHPELLAFLVEAHGFGGVEIRMLHPARPEAPDQAPDGRRAELLAWLDRSIYGPQDYAIVATKPSRVATKPSRQDSTPDAHD